MKDKRLKHLDNCSAPICACDTNPNYRDEIIWYPGESVCRHQPYEKFQEKQIEINKLVSKKKYPVDRYYTARDLENLGNRKRRKISNTVA